MMAITEKGHLIQGLNALFLKLSVLKPPLNSDTMQKLWFPPPVCKAEETSLDDLSLSLEHLSGVFIITGAATVHRRSCDGQAQLRFAPCDPPAAPTAPILRLQAVACLVCSCRVRGWCHV